MSKTSTVQEDLDGKYEENEVSRQLTVFMHIGQVKPFIKNISIKTRIR